MLLYLSSYQLGNKTEILKEWIENNDSKILLIPNARDLKIQDDTEKEKINQYIKMLEDVGFDVTLLDLKNYFNNKKKLYEDIRGYNAFCVTGGNVFVLRQAMKLSGFDDFLKNHRTNSEMLYVSWSAGSCVMTDNLDGLQLVDEPINPYNSDDVIYEGLGFVNYSIAPHYKSDHKESQLIDYVVDYMKKNNIQYKAISDGEVIIEYIN